MKRDMRGYGSMLQGRPSMMIFRMRSIWYNPYEHSVISWAPALQNKEKDERGHARIWEHSARMAFNDDLQGAMHMV